MLLRRRPCQPCTPPGLSKVHLHASALRLCLLYNVCHVQASLAAQAGDLVASALDAMKGVPNEGCTPKRPSYAADLRGYQLQGNLTLADASLNTTRKVRAGADPGGPPIPACALSLPCAGSKKTVKIKPWAVCVQLVFLTENNPYGCTINGAACHLQSMDMGALTSWQWLLVILPMTCRTP